MDGDSSDILGTPHAIVRDGQAGKWSGLSFGIKSTFILALLLVVYVVGIRAWDALLLWREKSYKLSMRRRHGIPDNDHRPFNVAYAAVMRARQDTEAAKRKARLEQVVLLGQEQRNAPPNQNIRQRPGSQRGAQSAWPSGVTNGLPGRFNPSSDGLYASISGSGQTQTRSHSASARYLDFAERYNPNPTIRVSQADTNNSPPKSGPSRRSSRKNIFVSDDEGRKRGFDGDESEDDDHSKKSRVEGDEFIDGDEDAEWQESPEVTHRGSKRVLRDEDNEDPSQSKQPRDKRARKVSLEKVPQAIIEDMDIDDNEDEDQVPELRATSSRGKKRDRAAAGSTFGGDDEDSTHEAELEDEAKARRQRRKRRTVAKRKSDAGSSSRGQKRDRDVEEGESDGESGGGVTSKVSRKKRGKKVVQPSAQDDEEMRSGSDVSMNDSLASSSRGRGRRIGDEWESNGVKYKIGPNGQRLRQALIKKARQKFNMPRDSQHPDRELNLEVCVETWLTEEGYREAKSQLLLAWQDSPKPSAEPEAPIVDVQDVPSPQPPAGKNLLWTSTSTAAASPNSYLPAQTPPGTPQHKSKNRDQYRQSIATNVGLRINPFHQQQIPSGKRIASAARVASAFTDKGVNPSSPGSPGLADSTNSLSRIGPRAFSKWEKQDLEAKAMQKLREANRKKEAEREQKLKEEKEKAEREQKEKEAAAAKPTIPIITLTKPVEVKPTQSETKPSPLSFAPPLGSTGPSSDATSKPLFGPPAGTSATPFTLPPMGAPAPPKPEDKNSMKPPVPTQPQPPPANSPFSFNNPGAAAPQPPANPFNANLAKKAGEPLKPQPTFSFPPPPTNTTAPVKPPAPPFSWNASSTPATQPASGADKGAVPQAPGANSLLSRLAPAGNTAPPAPQPQQNGPMFSFKPSSTEPSKPSSAFGNPAQTTTPQAAPSPTPVNAAPAAGSSGLKFNFGGKTTTAAPMSTSPPSTSSLSGALGGDSAKPPSNPFGFKAPTESTPAATNGTTTPKFSFGATAATPSSPFGAGALGGNKPTPPAPQTSNAPAKPAFSGFGGSSQPSSTVFGTPSQGTPAPVFGSNTSTNVFGGGGAANAFRSSAKSSEVPKPASVFGSSSTTPVPGDAPKNAFSFGNTTKAPTPAVAAPPSAAAPAPSPFSFKFGDAAKSAETPQATQPANGQSVFGKPASGPSAFGFGTGTGGFGFGNPPASTGQQQQ